MTTLHLCYAFFLIAKLWVADDEDDAEGSAALCSSPSVDNSFT